MKQICYPNPYGAIICDPSSGRNIAMQDLFGLQGGGSGSLFDPDYQAIIDYATLQGYMLPSNAVMNIQNTLVIDLKASGIWNELDVYYNFVTDGDRDFACINWKNPGTFTAVRSGGILFRPFDGFEGNGGDAYLDTTFIPANGVALTLNDASLFVSSSNPNAENSGIAMSFGPSVNDYLGIRPRWSDNNSYIWTNSIFAQRITRTNPPTQALRHTQRTLATQQSYFENGVLVSTQPTNSAGVSPAKIYLLAESNNNNPQNFSTGLIRTFGVGASLQGKEAALFNDWASYLSSIITVVYCPEYVAVLTYAQSQGFAVPSANVRQYQDQLLRALIANGIWQELDVYYCFLGDGDANFALINWKNPGTFQATGVNGPTYTPFSGFSGTGTQYLNSNYIVSQENISMFGEQDSANVNSGCLFGAGVTNTQQTIRLFPRTSNSIFHSTNDNTLTSLGGIGTSIGFWHNQRINNLTKQVFLNGVLRTQDTNSPATSPPAFPVFILSSNMSGTPTNTMASNITCFGAGLSLQGKEANLFSIWQFYKTQVKATQLYEAILAYADAQNFAVPTYPVRNAGRQLIVNLLISGIWDELDVFYNFLTNGDANFARINWKNPGTFQSTGLSFESMNGLRQTNPNDLVGLNSNFVPATDGVNYKVTDASFFLDVKELSGGDNLAGTNATSPRNYIGSFSGGFISINGVGTARPVTFNDSFYHLNVSGAVLMRLFTNGLETATATNGGNGLPNVNIGFLRVLDTSTFLGVLTCAGIGASLIGKEPQLFNHWSTYKNSVNQINVANP